MPEVFNYEEESDERDQRLEQVFEKLHKVITKEQIETFENALGDIRGMPIVQMVLATFQALKAFDYLQYNLEAMNCELSTDAIVALETVAELQRYLSGLIEMALAPEEVH